MAREKDKKQHGVQGKKGRVRRECRLMECREQEPFLYSKRAVSALFLRDSLPGVNQESPCILQDFSVLRAWSLSSYQGKIIRKRVVSQIGVHVLIVHPLIVQGKKSAATDLHTTNHCHPFPGVWNERSFLIWLFMTAAQQFRLYEFSISVNDLVFV